VNTHTHTFVCAGRVLCIVGKAHLRIHFVASVPLLIRHLRRLLLQPLPCVIPADAFSSRMPDQRNLVQPSWSPRIDSHITVHMDSTFFLSRIRPPLPQNARLHTFLGKSLLLLMQSFSCAHAIVVTGDERHASLRGGGSGKHALANAPKKYHPVSQIFIAKCTCPSRPASQSCCTVPHSLLRVVLVSCV
jgi:hypothetical protein